MSGTDPRASDPNAAGREGLKGDMGVSSERTGPYQDGHDEQGRTAGAVDEQIQGTGSHGSSPEGTYGTMSTSRGPADEEPETGQHGPEMDDTQQQATQEWRDQQPPADDGEEKSADPDAEAGIQPDRTVGESNTADVPSHDFDPTKNPGHSHG